MAGFCAAMAGAWLGFLAHNRHPARVFMGDTGSLAMGAALSAVALGLNTLVVAGLVHWIFDDYHGGDPIGQLLIIGLAAAGCLAASVSAILTLARRYGHGGDDHV